MPRNLHPTDREKRRANSLTARADKMSPLDVINWLIKRYCAAIEAEDGKGEAADEARIDQALTAAAALARSAAPYYHRRMKPADLAPGEPRKTELIVSWMPPPNYKPPHYGSNTPPSAPVEAEPAWRARACTVRAPGSARRE